MIGVVFKIKCRMPYVWVNFSALTTGSHKKETTHRCNVTYNPTHTQPPVSNPTFSLLFPAFESHLRVTRRNFQAKLQAEISDGIENFLAENQPNCKQHT